MVVRFGWTYLDDAGHWQLEQVALLLYSSLRHSRRKMSDWIWKKSLLTGRLSVTSPSPNFYVPRYYERGRCMHAITGNLVRVWDRHVTLHCNRLRLTGYTLLLVVLYNYTKRHSYVEPSQLECSGAVKQQFDNNSWVKMKRYSPDHRSESMSKVREKLDT